MTNGTTDATLELALEPPVDAASAGAAGGGNHGNGDGNGNGQADNPMPGNIRPSDIVGEMQTAYLDYAMSVIVSRALPDVRDGLKPVHRRILFAMANDLYLTHTKPHRKSARIVGEVLGKYHPHGDVAVYDAMVRMAQDFSLRYPLVDGQGNFGSIDGDGAAAMRYTEARLAEIADLMLTDLEKDTVDWHDNFDNSLEEPDILPAALPNLLINGSSGIAVGMATNIPPHNLGEIVDALVYLIDRYSDVEEITVDELLQFVKGPDFPTGGIVYRFREDKANEQTDVVAQGYSMGKARLVMQAKAHFEEMSRGRSRIVVTELPYQTNKTALIERIASLARDTKIEGITDLRDESDRTGMRIVIELTRNADPKDVLKDLFKYTPLQQTFGMQMLALVDGQPRLLSLKRALHLFIQHREVIIRRRSEYELAKARARAHIVEGLLKALDILDEVIATIRRSQTVETARNNLVKNFKFTEIQAQAILDMQLRRLAALERKKLKDEYDELLKRIAYLEDLLAHPEKILAVIREELLAQKEKYGDARRTQIVDRTKGTLTTTDLIPQQDVWVTVSADGELRRYDLTRLSESSLRQMAKYGEVAILTANTRDFLYLFCRDGRCTKIPIHELPQNSTPKHVADLSEFTRRDAITAAVSIPRITAAQATGYLFLATALGDVKRVAVADVVSNTNAEFSVMAVNPKDRLGWALLTPGEQDVMLVTGEGQSIRFSEEDVRSMGLAAGGVGGIKLKKKDLVIHAALVDSSGEGAVVTMTAQGYAKRSALSEYNRQGRNGSGIITHKPTSRTGPVAAATILGQHTGDEELLAVLTTKRRVEALAVGQIPVMGRGVQGKQVIGLKTNDQVNGLQRISESTTPHGFDPFSGNGDGSATPPEGGNNTGPTVSTNGTAPSTNGQVTAQAKLPKRKRATKTNTAATGAPVATSTAGKAGTPSRHRSDKSTKATQTTSSQAKKVAPSSTAKGRSGRGQGATSKERADAVQQGTLLAVETESDKTPTMKAKPAATTQSAKRAQARVATNASALPLKFAEVEATSAKPSARSSRTKQEAQPNQTKDSASSPTRRSKKTVSIKAAEPTETKSRRGRKAKKSTVEQESVKQSSVEVVSLPTTDKKPATQRAKATKQQRVNTTAAKSKDTKSTTVQAAQATPPAATEAESRTVRRTGKGAKATSEKQALSANTVQKDTDTKSSAAAKKPRTARSKNKLKDAVVASSAAKSKRASTATEHRVKDTDTAPVKATSRRKQNAENSASSRAATTSHRTPAAQKKAAQGEATDTRKASAKKAVATKKSSKKLQSVTSVPTKKASTNK